MSWTTLDTWIVVAGALTAASCALLGCFLLVRRMSMMGDAISHSVLPGLAAAFLITGSRDSLPMLAGAVIVGLLTAGLTQGLSRFGDVEESAAMGVVFTSFFALGLVLIVRAADTVDLDPGCVLYGAIELSPLDTVSIAGWLIPRAVVVGASVLALNLLVVLLLFKELRLAAFDPALATTLGFPAGLLHHLLMALVAVTTVASFETVGSILVIAMLVVPAAAAHLLTERLGPMLAWAVLLSLLCAALGHLAAITVPTWFGFTDTSTAGMMAVVAGLLFTAAWLFAPRHGLISRAWFRFHLGVERTAEDILGSLYRNEEITQRSDGLTHDELARYLQRGVLLRRVARALLTRRGWVASFSDGLRLQPEGRRHATELIRSHRLWERYLYERAAVRPDHVHATSEKLEHITDPALQSALAREIANPSRDPHGHVIPVGGAHGKGEDAARGAATTRPAL
jgi:manganese/zinc/iron transport system permease protein